MKSLHPDLSIREKERKKERKKETGDGGGGRGVANVLHVAVVFLTFSSVVILSIVIVSSMEIPTSLWEDKVSSCNTPSSAAINDFHNSS